MEPGEPVPSPTPEPSGPAAPAGTARIDPTAEPREDFDEEKAALLCAKMTRELFGDFAPGLLLLPAAERQRVQALIAYACTLFGFARQAALEGERLAQINRFEYTLESALSGIPVGQPIFLRMARENARRPWPVDALDELAACARRRATRSRPATVGEAEGNARNLARAVGLALLEDRLNSEANDLAGALIRLHALQSLGEEVRHHHVPLPVSELDRPDDKAALLAAVRRECARLRSRLLRSPRGLLELPRGYRRAAVYSLLAALRLLSDIEMRDEATVLAAPRRLGLLSRVGFLVRARWLRMS
jgi:phytoene/squalene synthetase